ncbi:MAG: type II toxin-antitoxin system RelE/ParE family toxin [Thermodesulfobacteriota bacterium]
MGKYRLVLKKSVTKDFRGIPKRDVARILRCFEALAEDPRAPGCEKLSGQKRYRVRQGAYRIVYEIDDNDNVVVVVKVGHRRAVYVKKQVG